MFNTPICNDLGFDVGELTNYTTFYAVALCIAIPIAAKAIERANLRLVMTASAIVVSVAEFAMGSFTKVYQWYIVGAIQGVCCAFLVSLTIPMLINNWFDSGKGTFMGLAGISSGLTGALLNAVISNVISQNGWRAGYHILGIILFAMTVPACALFAWRSPESVGAKPYGATAEQQTTPTGTLSGITKRQAIKMPAFYLLLLFSCLACLASCYNQNLADLAQQLGYPQSGTSLFVSIAMLGNVACKLTLGRVIDARGTAFASLLATGAMIVGFSLLIFGANPIAMYVGSALMGAQIAVEVVLIQAMTRSVFGDIEFSDIFAIVSVVINISTGFGMTLFGWIISLTDSYIPTVYAGLALSCAAFAAAAALSHRLKKQN